MNFSKPQLAFFFLTAIIAVYFAVSSLDKKPGLFLRSSLKSQISNNLPTYDNQSAEPVDNSDNASQPQSETGHDNVSQDEPQQYINSKHNFLLELPAGYEVSELKEKNGDTVLIQGPGTIFQIFVIMFDEQGPLTPERIRRDIPNLVIKNPQIADLDGAATIVFESYNPEVGETFEAWLINSGRLYQIMTKLNQKQSLIGLLERWKWE